MQWTFAKRVLPGIASDTNQLSALFDHTNAARLPRSTKLLRTVCVRAVSFRATTIGKALTGTYSKR